MAGRKRVEEHFSWTSIAERTKGMYQELLDERNLPAVERPSVSA